MFDNWRNYIAFLLHYKHLGSPVDEYVQSRCHKVISTALAKAFFDTNYLSAHIPFNSSGSNDAWQTLTEILVRSCSLQDEYVVDILEKLVDAEVNLNLHCRQGRM